MIHPITVEDYTNLVRSVNKQVVPRSARLLLRRLEAFAPGWIMPGLVDWVAFRRLRRNLRAPAIREATVHLDTLQSAPPITEDADFPLVDLQHRFGGGPPPVLPEHRMLTLPLLLAIVDRAGFKGAECVCRHLAGKLYIPAADRLRNAQDAERAQLERLQALRDPVYVRDADGPHDDLLAGPSVDAVEF